MGEVYRASKILTDTFAHETGRSEFYLAPFQRHGAKVPISSAGGGSPRWRQDNNQIFYLDENTLMVAAVRGGDSEIDVGDARLLFQTRMSNRSFSYAVTENGQRFLMNKPSEETSPKRITLVVNWPAMLKE